MVFADIGFIEAQHVEPLQDLQVAFQGQGRVFTWPMEGRHEYAELHSGGHCHRTILPSGGESCRPSSHDPAHARCCAGMISRIAPHSSMDPPFHLCSRSATM